MILTAAAIAAGGLTNASAQTATNAAPVHGRFLQRVAGRLNLTDGQKAQIKSVLSGQKDTLTTLLGQLHQARMDLRAAIQSSNANETSVRAAAARVAAVEGDLAVERMKIYGKIAPILTDEQRQQISEFEQRADDFVDGLIARIGDRLGE